MITEEIRKKLKPLIVSDIRTLTKQNIDVFSFKVTDDNLASMFSDLACIACCNLDINEVDKLSVVELLAVVKKIISLTLTEDVELEKN